MIQYEVVIIGEDEAWLSFKSGYEIRENQRIFLEKDHVIYTVNISKITHNLVNNEHIVRLNGHARIYSK